MATLTTEQETLITRAKESDKAWREAKRYAMEEAKRTAEKQIEQFAAQRANAVREAFAAGIPKSQISRRALGTTDPHTINRLLEQTEIVAPTLQALTPKAPERYTLTPATATKPAVLTLTLDPSGEEIAKALSNYNREETPAQVVTKGLHVAHFPITPTGATGMPLDPKKDWAHPLFLYFTGTDIQREADAWLAENYAVPAPAPTSAPATPTYELDDEDLAA